MIEWNYLGQFMNVGRVRGLVQIHYYDWAQATSGLKPDPPNYLITMDVSNLYLSFT